MTDFEKNHPGIAAQELWKLFLCKVEEQNLDRDFISAVGEVCAIGLDLSKYIVRFFPTFTLHDETHSANVCRWMWVLLGKEGRKMLTAHEAALLLMAACCHDIGMSVSEEQEDEMRSRNYTGWDAYFRQNLADDGQYEETKVISDRMLRNFIRMHHHERIGENLRESDWPDALLMEELDREVLLKLCRSHGTELTDADLNCREGIYDLRMCVVLLRLADLLDFDAGRTPDVLFRQMGLECPKDAESWRSAEEHQKNRAGKFRESFVNGRIPYVAVYDNPGVEQEIRKYLDWVDLELTNSRNCLSQSASHWKSLDLPYKVDDEKVRRKGYAAGKFCMTMDQDKVLDLLSGENLYSDAGVFVRELLQNSIDAVLMRAKQDPNFSLEEGLIQIDTWMDEEANTWFRIRDNGTGMNKHIIQNHFLKVGNSYYTSEEFKYANRHAPKGSYTAISRFGIGILSCFMGDKEHTKLKVSTKRFGEGHKNGLRLDVTGLHGYYFLCNEKDHPESEPWFPKMPSQNGNDQGYRTEPGTTICVNTNLLRMGDPRSIRNILDQYVIFPEVRVVYNGPNESRVYPTQQELMASVRVLNAEDAVKACIHKISDNLYMRLLEHYHGYEWKGKPDLVLYFKPLDLLGDSPNLMGVRIEMSVQNIKAKLKSSMESIPRKWLANAWINAEILYIRENGINIRFELRDTGPLLTKPAGINRMDIGWTYWMPVDEFGLSEEERAVWNMLWSVLRWSGAGHCAISYNGVLVEKGDKDSDKEKCCTALLLREDFQPQVNMARNKITAVSQEAMCCMIMSGVTHRLLQSDRIWRATERELEELVNQHPRWGHMLENNEGWQRSGHDYSRERFLLLLKKKESGGRSSLEVTRKVAEKWTADFPVGLFLGKQGKSLRVSRWPSRGYAYDQNHPFSRWIIENRKALVDREPALYDTMIQTMILKDDIVEIRNTLNNTLNVLRNYPGNPFHVPADLVLTEADFIVTD